MIKMANKEANKFTDDAKPNVNIFSEYQAPLELLKAMQAESVEQQHDHHNQVGDLLSMDENAPATATLYRTTAAAVQEEDLLGFTMPSSAPATAPAYPTAVEPELDIFGGTVDGPSLWEAAPVHSVQERDDVWATVDMLGVMSVGGIPTASVPVTTRAMAVYNAPIKKQVMLPSSDRFSALDALAGPSGSASTKLSSDAAMNKIMNFSVGGFEPSPHPQHVTLDSLAVSAPSFAITHPVEPPLPITYSSGSLKVSQGNWGDITGNEEDSENGFIMGGVEGAGLAPPPASAPPPPPPPAF
jgi:hypothetical protein